MGENIAKQRAQENTKRYLWTSAIPEPIFIALKRPVKGLLYFLMQPFAADFSVKPHCQMQEIL